MGTMEGGESTIDDRPEFIFAGFPLEMKRFLNSNRGLHRRVTDFFIIENC